MYVAASLEYVLPWASKGGIPNQFGRREALWREARHGARRCGPFLIILFGNSNTSLGTRLLSITGPAPNAMVNQAHDPSQSSCLQTDAQRLC